jgi:3-deoxy-7-phosphoheptulonate synthase
MLLRLRSSASAAELDAVRTLASALGYRARTVGERADLLQLEPIGGQSLDGVPGERQDDGRASGSPDHPARFLDLSAVSEVLDRGHVRELWQRAPGRTVTVVDVAGVPIGGDSVVVIAGPCAVEDRERLFEVARGVRDAGAALLRGGAYKPRTSPYSFQGLGERGLELLAEVREETGLGIVTEVLDPRDVERVAGTADMLQVGARSMANYALLKELGQLDKPVLLKRGFAATVEEWVGAAEYVLAGGNGRVVLCERGVRGFDRVTRNLLDVGAIAHLVNATHLPVIADPSHAAGRADLVPRLARAGLAAGAHGLVVEVHTAPAEVHSDGRQAIDLAALRRVVADARAIAALDGRHVVVPDASGRDVSGRDVVPRPESDLGGRVSEARNGHAALGHSCGARERGALG